MRLLKQQQLQNRKRCQIMFDLSDEKQKVLDTTGNLLVMGGPGSGKTTIALLKAKHIIESGVLQC